MFKEFEVILTVIIPTYNRADLLIEAIKSVLHQSFTQYEIIVVDDGSVDSTKDLIKNYSNHVIYIPIPHSGLPAKARNVGVENAKGKYIAFLDSDDQWCEDKLEKQIKMLQEHANIGLICSNAFIIDNSSKSRLFFPYDTFNSKRDYYGLIKDNFIITSSCIVKKELLERVGPFSEDNILRGIEDYNLWLKVGMVSDIYYMHEPLCFYRMHEKRISNEHQIIPHYLALIHMFSQIINSGISNTIQNPKKVEKEIQNKIFSLKLALLPLYFSYCEKRKAMSLFRELIGTYFEHTPKILLVFFKTIIRYWCHVKPKLS